MQTEAATEARLQTRRALVSGQINEDPTGGESGRKEGEEEEEALNGEDLYGDGALGLNPFRVSSCLNLGCASSFPVSTGPVSSVSESVRSASSEVFDTL